MSRGWAVYTPELVVNGTEQLLGSDMAASTRSIERALAEPASSGVTVKVDRVGPSRVSVDWTVATKQVAAGWTLGLALGPSRATSRAARTPADGYCTSAWFARWPACRSGVTKRTENASWLWTAIGAWSPKSRRGSSVAICEWLGAARAGVP